MDFHSPLATHYSPSPHSSGAKTRRENASSLRSIEQRNGAGPAGRAAFHFVGEASDGEAMRRKLFEIAQLFHMTIRNLATGFVTLPDDRGVVGFQPTLADMRKRRVPAPGVDAGDAHAARRQIKRRLAPHAAAGGEIFVTADAARSPRIDQNDVERFQLMADALEFGFDLGGGDHMT